MSEIGTWPITFPILLHYHISESVVLDTSRFILAIGHTLHHSHHMVTRLLDLHRGLAENCRERSVRLW